VVRARDANCSGIEFSQDALSGPGRLTALIPHAPDGAGLSRPAPPYVIQIRIGGVEDAGLKGPIDGALGQLEGAGGSAIAIWSRARNPQMWGRAVSDVEAILRPTIRSRITGVYLFGADVMGLFGEGPSSCAGMRVQWIPHPRPRMSAPWPVLDKIQLRPRSLRER
jgi:hypothetical protein